MNRVNHRRTSRAAALLPLAVFVFAVPVAQAQVPGAHKGQCRRISRQIDHFEGVFDTAEERKNGLWAEATLQHLDRLYERRGRLCPEYATGRAAAQRAQRLANAQAFLKAAGSAALRFFTFGAM